MSIPNVAVVGSGYWGKNLVRVFHELGVLRLVCDTSEEVLSQAQSRYGVETTTSLSRVLEAPEIRAVAIAAPAAQHFELVRRCLQHDKDVFVEKPLALHGHEGEQLVELANQRKRV